MEQLPPDLILLLVDLVVAYPNRRLLRWSQISYKRRMVLQLRLVSRAWNDAITRCDKLWTFMYGKELILANSVHRFESCCHRSECVNPYHYHPTGNERTTFATVLQHGKNKIELKLSVILAQLQKQEQDQEHELCRLKADIAKTRRDLEAVQAH